MSRHEVVRRLVDATRRRWHHASYTDAEALVELLGPAALWGVPGLRLARHPRLCHALLVEYLRLERAAYRQREADAEAEAAAEEEAQRRWEGRFDYLADADDGRRDLGEL